MRGEFGNKTSKKDMNRRIISMALSAVPKKGQVRERHWVFWLFNNIFRQSYPLDSRVLNFRESLHDPE